MNARNWCSSFALSVALGTFASGCGFGYEDLPSPGAPADHYSVDAVFSDALNLAPGAPVKVDGLPVGVVSKVSLDGNRARVTFDLDSSVHLRSGSRARLRYDTPLGEVYVEVTPEDVGERLDDGDQLRPGRSTTAPTVEDTLAQASLLVNGGGLGQLATITDELNAVVGGREAQLRSGLRSTVELLGALNDSQTDLTATLRDLRDTASILSERRGTLHRAVTRLAPAADVLRENQAGFTELLAQSDALTSRATGLLTDTEDDLIAVLTKLGPVLEAILASEDALVDGLSDVQITAKLLDRAIPGDFIGLDATLRIELEALLTGDGSGGSGGGGEDGGDGTDDGDVVPDLPLVPDLPDLPDLPLLGNLLQRGVDQ